MRQVLLLCVFVLASFASEATAYCYGYGSNSDYWDCDNGYQCVDESDRCNGHDDCDDGSDEEYCGGELEAYCYFDYQWECDSGQCVYDSDRCDGHDDCYDGSDEDDCFNYTALAIGLSIAGFVIFIVIPIIVCIVIVACIVNASKRRRIATTRVVTAATPPTSTVLATDTSHTTGYVPAPAAYPTTGVPKVPYGHSPPSYSTGYQPVSMYDFSGAPPQ